MPAFAIGRRRSAPAEKRFEDSTRISGRAAEDFAKDIERIVEPAAGASGALRESRVTIAVVGGAFVGVHQDVVGLAEFFEFLLRVHVARILIGMQLDRELAISALDFFRGSGALHVQDFVVITLLGHAIFSHTEQRLRI